MDILLIRHTSVDVPPGFCYGQTDVPLKPSFEDEASAVKNKLDGQHFDVVYTSPLSRCVKLATYCGYPEALRDDRLKEMNMGDWEMQSFDAITDPRLQKWYNDYLNVSTTNGESYRDIFKRVASFLDEMKTTKNNRVAIFAHGGILMCAQIYAGVTNPEKSLPELTPYGGIIEISI